MSLAMNKLNIKLSVIFALLITHDDGTEAHKIFKRSPTSESEPGGYTSLTRKIFASLASHQPSWAPRVQHSLLLPEPTAPLRKEEQQRVVAFPVLPPPHLVEEPPAEDNSGVASSKFTWSVNDPPSGNNYGHQESRTGDNVDGGYYTLLPDGRVLRVDYRVDPTSGFVAKIRYNQSDGGNAAEEVDLGGGRQDDPQSQGPPETTYGGVESSNAGSDTILSESGTAITVNDEQPAGSQSENGNQENLNDDNVRGDSGYGMPNSDNTAEKDKHELGFEEGQSTNPEVENVHHNSDNDQPDPMNIPKISGEQGIYNFSDSELQILLNEALKNYTDTEESPLPVDSSLSPVDISSFNGNGANSGTVNSYPFPAFPDINLSDIFNLESSPSVGFDPKFPAPPVFIPLDDNNFYGP